MSGGSADEICAKRAFTACATATVFWPDCLDTTSVTAGCPFRNDALRSSSWASTASPMSLIRTTYEPAIGDGDRIERLRVGDLAHGAHGELLRALVHPPARHSRFCWRSAAATSVTVTP